jgi:hypoxanthine phosphoribosyltransferase
VSDETAVLYAAEQIERRVHELGEAISGDYAGREPVLISVLKGGAIFLADLIRHVDLRLSVDFMSISPYGPGPSSDGFKVVRVLKDLDHDIGGQDVLIVEDLVDTGLTLSYLISTLHDRRPKSIRVCTLLDKAVRRIAPLEIGYTGFDCPDEFVVGYGLDLRGRYRNLPFIAVLPEHVKRQAGGELERLMA